MMKINKFFLYCESKTCVNIIVLNRRKVCVCVCTWECAECGLCRCLETWCCRRTCCPCPCMCPRCTPLPLAPSRYCGSHLRTPVGIGIKRIKCIKGVSNQSVSTCKKRKSANITIVINIIASNKHMIYINELSL
jgi:hypothetical protein